MKTTDTIIIQHEADTTPGTTLAWLEQKKWPFKVYKPYEDDVFPAVSEFKNLIICGGSMNVDQEEKFLWMPSEKKLIKESLQQNKKVLGLCLGAQLMAEALGAKVGPMGYSEVGWHAIDIQPHTLIDDELTTLNVFQWHSYCFSEVPNATHLARNEAWLNQGFVMGKNALGFQFHPETTVEWMNECADDKTLPVGKFCQTPDQIRNQFEKQKIMQEWYVKVLDRFFLTNSTK